MATPSRRRRIMYIKQGNYGMTRGFRLVGKDRGSAAGFSATITVKSVVDETVIVDAQTCTTTLSGSDTLVAYTVQDGDFDTAGDYTAEITWTKSGYVEDCKTFQVEVIPSVS